MAVISAAAGTANASVLEKPLAKAVEDAMVLAVQECIDEGITDPAVILERKAAARQRVKGERTEGQEG